MSNNDYSLQQLYPRKYGIPSTLVISAVLLITGLLLPCITLKELVFWKSTFSVLTGIQSLFTEGHFILGIIIVLFSVLFPFFKLIVLSVLWYLPLGETQRNSYIHWLGILGKWSMLDVFVVAITIVITKLSGLAHAEPRIGIYFFFGAILLAMIATERIEKLIKE